MASRKINDIIIQLSDWISSLKLNPATRQWELHLKPGNKIIIYSELNAVVKELERHVVSELIEISSEVLGIKTCDVVNNTRLQELADLRSVISYLIHEHFQTIRQASIYDLMGWTNRCSIVAAHTRSNVREIREKIEKVYKAYPHLRQGRIDIIDK